MAGQPARNKGLIFGLIKGNQWVFISPDHKAGYFWGGYVRAGGSRSPHLPMESLVDMALSDGPKKGLLVT